MRIILGLVLMLMVSCKGNQSTPQNTGPDVVFTFQKTACFGTCPEYTLTVFHENKAILKGKKNFDLVGEYDCKDCDTDMMARVVEYANEINFWDMEEIYDPGVTDLPSTIFTFYIHEKPKQVTHVMEGPKELDELEKLITDLYLKRKWVKKENK